MKLPNRGARVSCVAILIASAIALALSAGSGSGRAAAHAMTPAVGASPHAKALGLVKGVKPTVHFGCQDNAGCYDPTQMRRAYGFDRLSVDGTGRTIVIVDAFQSPTIQQDLSLFDSQFGVPAGTLNIIAPDGLTPFDPNDANQVGWSGEITLDVEWAHAIAPGATIDLVLAKSNQDGDILSATQYAVDHNLGDVISQSFGEGETCMDPALLAAQHALFRQATAKGITLLASSGDQGSAQPTCDGSDFFKSASTPASDPNVTGVGGTRLVADSAGVYQSETTWNEVSTFGAAGGGGFSTVYGTPSYQHRLHLPSRGVPDVAYNAAINGGVLAVWSVPLGAPAFFLFGGTSAGSPQWAGLVADADQLNGGRIGLLNNRLYGWATSASLRSRLFHDITTGNNSFGSITGFAAVPGWDAATGVGSPKANTLVSMLAG
jgi:subtilase family serine protease